MTQLSIFDAPDPSLPLPIRVMRMNADRFTDDFMAYLPENLHVFAAFEREAMKIVGRGWKHYSARTIIEVLRHHTALQEDGSAGWKLNNLNTPYLARLFALLHPDHADLFEFRESKAVRRDSEGVAA